EDNDTSINNPNLYPLYSKKTYLSIMGVNINVSPENIDKSLDMVRDFVKTIGGHAASELGLLLGDKIRQFRFTNQVKILSKAKILVERNNLPMSVIPIKILVPLLESCSLEEDEDLQDLWANLLANMLS